METIKFRIIKYDATMCRITTSDARSVYKKIADGGCICSIDVMLSELEHIKNEVEKLGNIAIFTFDSI